MSLDLSYLQAILAESTLLKYSAYLLPLLVYIVLTSIFHISAAEDKKKPRTKIDYTANIETDSKNIDEFDDELLKPHLPDREHVPYRGVKEVLDTSGDHFYKLANDRRSVRKFAKNKPVDIKVIEKCILAAGMHFTLISCR